MSVRQAVAARQAAGHLFAPLNLAVESYTPTRIAPTAGVTPGEPLQGLWDSDKAIREGLKVSSALSTCIGRVAEKGASVPWYEWEVAPDGRERRVGEVEYIERPRKDGKRSRFQMMEVAHHDAYIAGNALFGIVWDGGQKYRIMPREMHRENPHGCYPVPHRVNFIDRYEWEDAAIGGRRSWDAKDIIHVIGRCDPSNDYWGWSILESLALVIDADLAIRKLNFKRFARGGYPGMIIIDEELDQSTDRQSLEDDLNARADRYAGAYMVLGGKQKVEKQSSMTEPQLGLLSAMGQHRDEIAVAIGFHPAMFSSEAATYSNLKEARLLEWQIVVLRNARFADAFSNRLIPAKDHGKRFIAPDYSEVEELQGLTEKIDKMAKLVQECRVCVDDAIALVGIPLPKQEGGDRPLVEGGLVPAGDAAEGLANG